MSKKLSSKIRLYNDNLLTSREIKCLSLLSIGKSAKEIARILEISPRTIETHVLNIKKKLNLNTKSQIVNFFWENSIFNNFIKENLLYI